MSHSHVSRFPRRDAVNCSPKRRLETINCTVTKVTNSVENEDARNEEASDEQVDENLVPSGLIQQREAG